MVSFIVFFFFVTEQQSNWPMARYIEPQFTNRIGDEILSVTIQMKATELLIPKVLFPEFTSFWRPLNALRKC